MIVNPPTYGTVCAFLCGFDRARSGGALIGLQQWLVVRTNDGNNRHWQGLAEQQLVADDTDADQSDEIQAIRALGRLLAEFFEFRRKNGITKIFHEYGKWLLRRSWYDGPLRRESK